MKSTVWLPMGLSISSSLILSQSSENDDDVDRNSKSSGRAMLLHEKG